MVRRAAIAIVLAGCAAAPRWDAMTPDARRSYMERTVMPEMRRLFAEHDEARFARMRCATCHGTDGEARRWKMPNSELLLEEHDVTTPHARMNAFMRDRVTPEMARLLGRPTFDCFGCHTLDR